jgi:uncharacterized damage-inducible protein DinB
MKYNLLLFVFYFMQFTEIRAQSEKLIESHFQKMTNAREYTLAVAKLMPDSLYSFKPVEGEMSFKEQLIHISQNLFWLSSTYLAENSNPFKESKERLLLLDKKEVMELVQKAYDYSILSVSQLDTTTLSKELKFFAGNKDKYQFLNLIEDHQTHHRAQLIVYLRLNRIKPPDYIGW